MSSSARRRPGTRRPAGRSYRPTGRIGSRSRAGAVPQTRPRSRDQSPLGRIPIDRGWNVRRRLNALLSNAPRDAGQHGQDCPKGSLPKVAMKAGICFFGKGAGCARSTGGRACHVHILFCGWRRATFAGVGGGQPFLRLEAGNLCWGWRRATATSPRPHESPPAARCFPFAVYAVYLESAQCAGRRRAAASRWL